MTTHRSTRPNKARLGMAGYAALLAEFAREPSTIAAFHQRTGIGRDTAYRLVPEMHAKGMLHISGWLLEPRRPVVPIYSYGPGQDAQPPTVRPNGRPIVARVLRRERVSPEILALRSLMDALQTPIAVYELHEETGMHRDTIRHFLKAMRKHGLARIAAWQKRDCGGGQYPALWALGGGKNASYPARKDSGRQACREWRARVAAAKPMLQLHQALTPANDGMRSAA